MLKKRLLQVGSVILVAAMVFSAAACGTGGNGEPDPSDGNGVAPDEPIVLSFLHVFSGPRGEAMDLIVQGFNDSQDRIIVEHEHVPGWYGGLLEQLQTLAVANQTPDLTIMGLSGHNFLMEGLGAVSMASYIEQDNFDLDDFFPQMLSLGFDADGNQFALPFAISTPLLYANIDLLEEVGLSYVDQPETWTDIRSWAKTISDGTDADGVAFQLDFDTWQFQMLLETHGGQMADLDNQEILFDGEAGRRVMDLWLGMKHEDGSWPNMSGGEAAENFLNGDLGMITATTGNLTAFTAGADFNMGIMLLPLYDDAQNRNPRVIPAGGSNIYILPSEAAREAAAWEFVKYAMSPEAGAIIVEGMGYMAARESLLDEGGLLSDYIAQNPQATRSYDQVVDLSDWFNWPGVTGARIDSIFLANFEEAFLQQKTGEEVLDDVADEVRTILGW